MRVVIADDSVLLREGLTLLLADGGHDVVVAVGDGQTFIDAMQTQQPDLGIVDVRMPPTHTSEGLAAAVDVLRAKPAQPIMVLSQYVERSYADELLDRAHAGVGYLLKDRISDIDDFLATLEQVRSGQTVLDPQVVRQLMSQTPAISAIDALTPREHDVLTHIASGLTNAAIARHLVVTEGAVEKHVQRIFAKLDLPAGGDEHRRVAAVLTYLRSPSST